MAEVENKKKEEEKPNEKEAEQVYFDIKKLDEYFKNIPTIDIDYYEYNHIW